MERWDWCTTITQCRAAEETQKQVPVLSKIPLAPELNFPCLYSVVIIDVKQMDQLRGFDLGLRDHFTRLGN